MRQGARDDKQATVAAPHERANAVQLMRDGVLEKARLNPHTRKARVQGFTGSPDRQGA